MREELRIRIKELKILKLEHDKKLGTEQRKESESQQYNGSCLKIQKNKNKIFIPIQYYWIKSSSE